MRRLAFIDVDGRWNLPLLTGALALVLLVATTVVRLASAKRTASVPIRVATLIFIVWALFAAAIPWAGDATFSPYPQLVARNQALFVGSILAAAAVITFGKKIPARMWLEPATLVVIAALACAQFSWDVAATQRWRAYMTDVRDRLAASDGLISWEQAFGSGDAGKNEIWRAMGFGWTMPSLSLVLQSGRGHKATRGQSRTSASLSATRPRSLRQLACQSKPSSLCGKIRRSVQAASLEVTPRPAHQSGSPQPEFDCAD
jgi:hypothetical protein